MKAASAVLDEFLAERLASPLGPDQKRTTSIGVDHLRRAMEESGLSLTDFVQKDGLAPYVAKLEASVSSGYIEHLKDVWRAAFRRMCAKRLLALDYARCVVPSQEKDPHDFEKCERGYPEAILGIYPRCLVPRHTAKSIRANAAVPGTVVHEYHLLVANIPEMRRDSTRAVLWFLVRQLVVDMKLKSLKELSDEAGAARLMDYFWARGYVSGSGSVRKVRGVFRHLKNLGLIERSPFDIKVRVGEVLRWGIDFSRLPEATENQKFVRVDGRRHAKSGGRLMGCWLTEEEIKKVVSYRNPPLRGWRGKPAAGLREAFREAQENIIARTVLYFPPRPGEFWSMNRGEWALAEGDETTRSICIAWSKRP